MVLNFRSFISLSSIKILDKATLFFASVLLFQIDQKTSDDFLYFARILALATVLLSFGMKQTIIRKNLSFKAIGFPILIPTVLCFVFSLIFKDYFFFILGISLNVSLGIISSVLVVSEKIRASIVIESFFSSMLSLFLIALNKNFNAFEIIFFSRLPVFIYALIKYSKQISFDLSWFQFNTSINFYFQNGMQSCVKNIDAIVVRNVLKVFAIDYT